MRHGSSDPSVRADETTGDHQTATLAPTPTSPNPSPNVSLDSCFRTKANGVKVRAFVKDKNLPSELADILLGEEHRPEVLARNLDALLALARDGQIDALVARYAVSALGLYKDRAAYDALVNLAQGSADWSRAAALYSLSSWIPERREIVELLSSRLSDASSQARFAALQVLLRKGVNVERAELLRIIDEEGIQAQIALDLLEASGGTVARSYLGFVATEARTTELRYQANEALKRIEEGTRRTEPSDRAYTITFKSNSGEETLRLIEWPPSRP